MDFKYKILIISLVLVGILIIILVIDPPSEVYMIVTIVYSIVISFLGLAYYEERQESAEHEKTE